MARTLDHQSALIDGRSREFVIFGAKSRSIKPGLECVLKQSLIHQQQHLQFIRQINFRASWLRLAKLCHAYKKLTAAFRAKKIRDTSMYVGKKFNDFLFCSVPSLILLFPAATESPE